MRSMPSGCNAAVGQSARVRSVVPAGEGELESGHRRPGASRPSTGIGIERRKEGRASRPSL